MRRGRGDAVTEGQELSNIVRTLDEKLADDRQNKEAEYACLREQNDKDLAELDARIKSAKEERQRVEEELFEGHGGVCA